MKKFTRVLLVAIAYMAILGITNKSYAQEETNPEFIIRGHVIDASNGEHISYATATIEGTTIGAIADEEGHFILKNLPEGEVTIEVSMVGYSPVTKSTVVKRGRSFEEMTFSLKLDAMMLDQVIVSASRTETTRRKSPTLVSVMPSDMFELVRAPTLADALTFNTGIRVDNNCQNCGFTQVRINGLEGNYSQVLIDSRPIFSSLTSVYGLESIPAAMVDRVEVVRGGGSALFGSSAIGGTINIITKTPEYSSAEVGTNLTVMGKGSTDSNTTASATYVTDNSKAGFTMFAQSRKRKSYDANDDGFTEIPELESKTIGLRTFFKTSNYSKLSLSYDATRDYRRGGDNLELPEELAEVCESASHDINAATINFDLFSHDYKRKLNIYSSVMNTKRDSYYNGAGTTYDLTIATGAQLTSQFKNFLFMPSEFVLGVEHVYNKLDDRHYNYSLSSTGDDAFQFAEDGVEAYINTENFYSTLQTVNTVSLYAQNEWKTDKWGILVGARADYNDFMEKVIVSPRANLRFNPSNKFNFRATYASGYRSPQLFDEDLHIMIVQGEQSIIVNDPDLKEEKSHSVSLSADTYQNIGNVSTNFLVEGFYTVLKDAFSLSEAASSGDGVLVQTRTNSAGAKVYGGSFEARASVPRVVDFQAGFTVQRSKYNESEERSNGEATNLDETDVDELTFSDDVDQFSILRSPDTYGYFSAKFPITRKFGVTSTATYTGSMLVEHVMGGETNLGGEYEYTEYINSERFFDMNLIFNYDFTVMRAVRMTLTAGVQNIFNSYQSNFDTGADRDAGFVYGPMSPRRYTFGVKLAF